MTTDVLDAQVVTVTPDVAQTWLRMNKINRRLRTRLVEIYGRDMRTGNWSITGAPIIFNGDGELLDGQHRLAACVKSGAPFRTLVVRGVPSTARISIDAGAKRTFADVLRMRGHTNHHVLAAAINMGCKYDQGDPRNPFSPSHHELVAWLDTNPKIIESTVRAQSWRTKVFTTPSVLAIHHYLVSRIDAEEADRFMKMLTAGTGYEDGSPLLAYRRWSELRQMEREKPRSNVYFAVLVKASNAWRRGATVRQLMWKPASGEPFPQIFEGWDSGQVEVEAP